METRSEGCEPCEIVGNFSARLRMVVMGMLFSSKKLRMPGPGEALPGRNTAMRVGETHFVNRHKIVPPFPEGAKVVKIEWSKERTQRPPMR